MPCTTADPAAGGSTDAARRALALLDLTSLRDDDSPASIEALAARAQTAFGAPAALCVYPAFVPVARRALEGRGLHRVKVATVVNFPRGDATPAAVAAQIAEALAAGADEIDAVLPWRALRAGDGAAARRLVAACRGACDAAAPAGRPVLLKVIVESGELQSPALIRRAGEIAIAAGADFLKTSTGKAAVNATPEAVAALLEAIVAAGGTVGLKIAGGVATVADAEAYLAQVGAACGAGWISPSRVRFGASGLLAALVAALGAQPAPDAAAGY